MRSDSIDGILKEMDILKGKFTNCRAYFPYVPDNLIGAREAFTAPYYIKRGFKIRFLFDKALTQEDVQRTNEIGHYINQNFIVRLCAMLESYHFLSNEILIDNTVAGWEELDMVRRLRNHFAHTSGRYDHRDQDQKKLVERLISYFDLGIVNPEDFPLSIGEVIDRLFEGCKRYVKGKYQKNIKQGEQDSDASVKGITEA